MCLRLAALGPSLNDASAYLFADAAAVRLLIERFGDADSQGWTTDFVSPPVVGYPVLNRLLVQVVYAPLQVFVHDDSLVFEASKDAFRRLADELELFVEHNDLLEPGVHCHIDCAEDDTRSPVLPASAPLIVAGWIPDS